MEEIWLGPLSREQAAQQMAVLAGAPVPTRVADELYGRAEGNPFFAEQLVAAALTARPAALAACELSYGRLASSRGSRARRYRRAWP